MPLLVGDEWRAAVHQMPAAICEQRWQSLPSAMSETLRQRVPGWTAADVNLPTNGREPRAVLLVAKVTQAVAVRAVACSANARDTWRKGQTKAVRMRGREHRSRQLRLQLYSARSSQAFLAPRYFRSGVLLPLHLRYFALRDSINSCHVLVLAWGLE